MPSTPPEGEPAPADGSLPSTALEPSDRDLGIYLHVPFCASRCGYCDFNTYTADELGSGASRQDYVTAALSEIDLAAKVLAPVSRPVSTVFVGGGTPTLLHPDDLGRLLDALRAAFGLAAGAEVTVEANPESVSAESLKALRDKGFSRISFGMQSASPTVLQVLDRRHTPGRPLEAVGEARAAGFDSVTLDLIYGTPGESLEDWRRTVESALSAEPDHLSAYALIVEDGTRLAANVRRGVVPAPDDDDLADKYLLADEVLSAAGLSWYEVSNWARPGHACRHNLAYWRGENWWGIGPGAHSHVGGIRWWNVRHPATYARRLAEGVSPAQAREVLSPDDQHVERVLLQLRLAEGLPVDELTRDEAVAVPRLVASGLLDEPAIADRRLCLTQQGRLLADGVIRELLS